MKILLPIVVLFYFSATAFGQVHKRFLDKNNKPVSDSTKAQSYILYQQENDTLYSAVELNMQNIPVAKGAFSDEALTIPVGRFTTYQTYTKQRKVDEHQSTIDTLTTVATTGFYINGLREGIWISYYINGKKSELITYENSKKNGLCETFDLKGKVINRYYYVKGLKEGDAYSFRPDSSIKTYVKYWHDRIIDFKEYGENDIYHGTYPGFNFDYHVHKYLKKLGLPPSHGSVIVEFTVTTEGKLIKPSILIGLNPILDEAVKEAVLNSPKWYPAKRNKKSVEQKTTLAIEYDSEKEEISFVTGN